MANSKDIIILTKVFTYLKELEDKGVLIKLEDTEQSFLAKYSANELALLNIIYDIVDSKVSNINNKRKIYLDILFEMEKNIILYGGDFTTDIIKNMEDIDYIERSLIGLRDFHDEVSLLSNNKMMESNILKHWGHQILTYSYFLLDHKYINEEEKKRSFNNFFENVNQFCKKATLITDERNFKKHIGKNIYVVQDWGVMDLFIDTTGFNEQFYKIEEVQNDLIKDYELNEDKNNFQLNLKFQYLKGMGFKRDSLEFIREGIHRAYSELDNIKEKNIFLEKGINENNGEINIQIKFYPKTNATIKKIILSHINKLIKNVYTVEVFKMPKEKMDNIEQVIRKTLLEEKLEKIDNESIKRFKNKI